VHGYRSNQTTEALFAALGLIFYVGNGNI